MSEGTVPCSTSKSKQERIRDNQRRSRARRSAYLAELESKVSECNATCREAELRSTAFLELQIENSRLRELLAFAGITEELIESYVAQGLEQARPAPQQLNSSQRQLKPKVSSLDLLKPSASVATSGPSTLASSHHFLSRSRVPVSPSSNSSAPKNNTDLASYATTPITVLPLLGSTGCDTASPFDFLFRQSSLPDVPHMTRMSEEPFRCEAFETLAAGPLLPADENTVLCSVARSMIDQYHVSTQDMEIIKQRLSSVFTVPKHLGSGCGVSGQVLFQVLNELSTREI